MNRVRARSKILLLFVNAGLTGLVLMLSHVSTFAQIPPPTIVTQPTTPVNVCKNQTFINTFTATGTGLSYRWYITGPPGCEFCSTALNNGFGYSGVFTNSLAINTTNAAFPPGTYYYFCEVTNAADSRYTNTIQFNILPSPTTTPGVAGSSRCGAGSMTLSAGGATTGQTYRWFTAATGSAIPGQTASTYTTPSISSTTTYYVAIAGSNGCTGPRAAVVATINDITTPTTIPGSRCGTGTVTLGASGGANGQYRWYTTTTGGAIGGQTNSTYTIPSLTTTTTFYVTINNGLCESARIPITATVNTIPGAPLTTGAARCGTGTVTLNAAGGSAGQYRWYTAPSGGAIAGQLNAAYTTPSIAATTTYYVAISDGTCESARIAVTATINAIPTAPTVTNGSRCGNGTVTLNSSGGTAGQFRWYTAPSGGAIGGQVNASYTTPSLSITTTYYVSINNGTCESARIAVTAAINTIPNIASVTGAGRCGSGTVTLNASGAAAGQYRWYTAPTGGAIAGETNASYITPSLATTTTYYVAINNGACESARTSVAATITPGPAGPSTTGGSVCGSGAITLTATGGAPGQYRWYAGATGGNALPGQVNGSFETQVLTTSTTYHVSIDNGSCESTRVAVTATVSPLPAAPAIIGASGCSSPLTLTASGGAAGQYRWYPVATGGLPIAGATNSTFSAAVSETTTYYVSINNGSCESARVPVVATVPAICNEPPVIQTTEEFALVGSIISFNVLSLISDPNNNLDLSTLAITGQPKSGATATIDANGFLKVDYSGVKFSGLDELMISICDLANACVQQSLSILVDGGVNIFNGISPNGDGKNDLFILDNIDVFPSTRENTVSIYNRWGDEVASFKDYDNKTRVFNGMSADGKSLPAGVYYYKISFKGKNETLTGYFQMKK